MQIKFELNGSPITLDLDPVRPLLDVLREDLGLTGTKQGCDHEGECGACTVLLNGSPVRSCLTPVGKIHQGKVLTIEGIGSREQPHPLQEAFIKEGAVQCGFCTPGMLLTAKSLLDNHPQPSREQIKEALAGNLCRCTGYRAIISAVQNASARQPGREQLVNDPEPIGGSEIREDAWLKVSGQSVYAGDVRLPDLQEMLVLRCPHPHARLVRLDTSRVESLPGNPRVITWQDIPGENGLGDYSQDEPVLVPVGEPCRMEGTPVALVVADSVSACRAAAAAVRVEYQALDAVFSATDALESTSPEIYPGGNLLASAEINWGDLEEAQSCSDVILDAEYETSWQEHAALEPETLVGYLDQEGRLVVLGGTHEPHWQAGYIAACLNLDPDQVRVIVPPTGGSFGGRQDPWPFLALALGVHHSRGPVRLRYSRGESFLASPKRHPYLMRFRLGAASSGRLTSAEAEILVNTGGYDGHGQYIVDFALSGSGGPYQFQAVRSRARSIYTNGPKGGQFRGFGTPQSTFALECCLDQLSQILEIDPLELRRQNILREGAVSYLGYPVAETLGFEQVLDAIQPSLKSYQLQARVFNADQAPGSPFRQAAGLAGMWYRFGKSGSLETRADAGITPRGELVIYCSAPDYGQGSSTVMSQIAAGALGLPRDRITLINADTGLTPDSGIQGASRATYFVGSAVLRAATTLRDALLGAAAEMLDRHPAALTLGPSGIETSPERGSETLLPYRLLAEEMHHLGLPTHFQGIFDLSDKFPERDRPRYLPLYVTGAQAVLVQTHTGTGEVQVLKIAAAHDLGRTINRRDALGQIEGAIMMGLGSALMEEFIPGTTSRFGDYYLPTARSTPELEVFLVEVPSQHGPLGAKGLGEAAILPTAPAIINAVSRSIGARIFQLPATPERVLAAIRAPRDRENG